jgi:hypothetical protein
MADPASAAVAAGTTAAKLFQTTLVVLYFTTAAKTVTVNEKTKPDFEKHNIWTLQSTSQIPTENPNMCLELGVLYIHEFDDVSTITVRGYCMCPDEALKVDDNNACINQKKKDIAKKKAFVVGKPQATIIRLGPNSTVTNPSGE